MLHFNSIIKPLQSGLLLCQILIYWSSMQYNKSSGTADAFVKLLLKSPPPLLDYKDLWRRSNYNIAVYNNYTLTLSRSLEIPTPSYVQILDDQRLSVTSFSLLRKGSIMQFDLQGIQPAKILKGDYLWPNELSSFRDKTGQSIMLVSDGFLMPGQNDGGIYAILDSNKERPFRITSPKEGWFYHRAMYVKLPGGGDGILTARANKPIMGEGKGELVWLVIPPSGVQQKYLDEVVLAEGPDVMFEVFDQNEEDNTIEIVAAHFFGRKLSIHSIKHTKTYPFIEVVSSSSMNTVGRPYGLCLASFAPAESDANSASHQQDIISTQRQSAVVSQTMSNDVQKYTFVNRVNRSKYLSRKRNSRGNNKLKSLDCSSNAGGFCNENHFISHNGHPTHILVTTHECSYDISSAINMAFSTMQGDYPQIKTSNGQSVKALYGQTILANSNKDKAVASIIHDSNEDSVEQRTTSIDSFVPNESTSINGGSLFTYEIPKSHKPQIKTENVAHNPNRIPDLSDWRRSTLFTGFKVRGWGGIFSPGAPGFPYVFRMPNKPESSPLILLAGDCTGSAYIFAPQENMPPSKGDIESNTNANADTPFLPKYKLAFEVECGATVGSAAVSSVNDGSGDVNLFIPAYELNKIHVFRLSDRS